MQKLITVNLSYYNQPKNILFKHIEYWKTYPQEIKNKFTFFIIDDCSKIPAEEFLKEIDTSDLDLHLYRVEVDLVCNISGVRNLGGKECKTPWYMILDMDTLISPLMAEQLVYLANKNIENKTIFYFNRKLISGESHEKNNRRHPAVSLMRTKDYWNVGGCEEDLVGSYGYTDTLFKFRCTNKVKSLFKEEIYIDFYPEGEADINRDTSRNERIYKDKIKNNTWSNSYVRFPWKKIF